MPDLVVSSDIDTLMASADNSEIRSNPGLEIGVDVQAHSAILDATTASYTGFPEGTEIKSTGETGGTKFLREDGDGTCSWVTLSGGGDMLAANNLSDVANAATSLSNLGGIGAATTDTLTNKTIDADGTGNVITNIGSSEIKAEMITGQTVAAAFASGDKFLIVSGGALEQADYDDLPGGGGMTSFTAAGDSGGGQAITDGNTLTIAGGTGITTADSATDTVTINHDAHTGDVTGSTALTIADEAVTYAKMQHVSATDKLLGRSTAGAGDVEEIACTAAGRALLDDADAAAQRTTLGVDAAGTDNSTDVTLAGTPDYITISGQVITRNQVDMTTDVTGALPVANGGTGATTLTDGGVLLGSGTGAVTAMAVLADGEMIVGDGTTDPVAESGATLRTSIGCDDAANLTTGTIPAARVGTDHIDAMTEIASAIKTGSGSTLMTTRTGVYRHMWISAGAMVAAASGSAATGTKDDGTNVQFDYFAFDGTANEDLWFDWAMPVEWDGGTIKVKFFWIPASGASASDGVTLELSAVAVGDDDAWDAAMGTAVHVDDTVTAGTSGDLHITAATAAITIGGSPTAGELVSFYVQRLATDAADTMAEDLWLRGIMIQYQESATEPSAW